MTKPILMLCALLFVSGCQIPLAPPRESPVDAVDNPLRPVRSEKALSEFDIAKRSYAGEETDAGTARFTSLIPNNFNAPTPLTMPGARRLTTAQLLTLLQRADHNAVLINVQPAADGSAELIAGSVWLSGAGRYGKVDDAVQTRYADHLKRLTGGDTKRTVILYCADSRCWRAYNAGIRAMVSRYRKVHWYRGGLRAWYEAGLPTVNSQVDVW